MAVASDDDVQDGDTTAAGIAPAASSADEEEDRTVQQPPDPKLKSAIARELAQPSGGAGSPAPASTPRAPVAVPSASKPGVSHPTNVTSKRMTVVGLAPPAVGSAAAPPASRAPTNISPLATMMDKKVGPTSTNPTSGPGSTRNPAAAMGAKPPASGKATPASARSSGSAAKMPIVAPALGPPPSNEADEEDASITATAPAPRVDAAAAASTGVPSSAGPKSSVKAPPLPLTVPGQVQIREMPALEEESLDETEVRTVVSGPLPDGAPASSNETRKVAPVGADVEEDDEIEDSVTTQAPSAVSGGRLPEEDQDEPKTSPPMRMPPPIPAAGRSPFDEPPIRSAAASHVENDEDAYNVEDSVTTRGPAVPDFRLDDSVVTADSPALDLPPESSGRWPSPVGARVATMSQALGLPPKNVGLPPAIEDGTEGTTNRFAGQGIGTSPTPAAGSPPHSSSADALGRPATNKKAPPRPATLASPAALNLPPKVGAAADDDEEDLHEDNRTAVMLGAPVKPPPTGRRAQMAGGMATHLSAGVARAQAPVEKSSSESGLRVAPHEPPQPPPQNDERASLGAMMQGALHGNPDRGSGVGPREYPSQPLPALQPHQVQHHYPASEPNLALGATIPATSPLMAQQLGTAATMGPNGGMGPGAPMPHMPQMQQYDFASTIKKPRYGLLVGLVALLSFAIPLVLFLWLHQNAQEAYDRSKAEVASDKQGLAPPQGAKLLPPAASSAKKPPRR